MRVICRSAAASWYPSTTRQIRSAMAWLTRAVPIASNGFMAATSRNPAPARTMPSLGTAISPSVSTVIRTLSVSSGTRLNSSRYSRAPARIARSSGPSVKLAGTYPSASTCAGSYCPISLAGVSSALPSAKTTALPACRAMSRSRVDLPVPGGPSITTCRPASSATVSTSRSRRSPTMGGGRPARAGRPASPGGAAGGPGSGAAIHDHAADVLAVQQVLVALVDLVEGVGGGDQLVQLEVAGPVELHHPRDVVERVTGTEQAALDALLEQGQQRAGQLDRVLGRVGQAGHHHRAALADRVEGVRDDLGGHDAHRDDRLVGAHPAGQLGDQLLRLLGGLAAVRGAELLRDLPLVGQRVDRHHVPGAGQRGPLDGVDAHAAEVLAAAVEPVGPVRQAAIQDGGAQVAQVRLAGRAPPAVAAHRQERADHVVAGLQLGDALADLLDDPGTLVAAHQGEARHDVAVPQMLVGMAQARGYITDEHLAGLGGIEVELGDLEVLAHPAQHCSPGLH